MVDVDWFENSARIREGIIDFAKQYSDVDISGIDYERIFDHIRTELKDATLEGLMSHLENFLGRQMTLSDIGNSFCDRPASLISKFNEGDVNLSQIFAGVNQESQQYSRIETMLGKLVPEMTQEEMEANALRLFTITRKEYEALAEEKGIPLTQYWNGPYEHHIDSTFLFGALEKAFDKTYSIDEIIDKMGSLDLGLGTLHDAFIFDLKGQVYLRRSLHNDFGLRELWEVGQETISRYREMRPQFDDTETKLSAMDKIPAPELQAKRTISLDMLPIALAYTPENDLIVMGKKDNGEIHLEKYDSESGDLIASSKTSFEYNYVNPFAFFGGSLTVGTNGVVYAGGLGKIQLFDTDINSLDRIVSIENGIVRIGGTENDGSQSLIHLNNQIMSQNDGSRIPKHIYMAVMSDGLLYLSLTDVLSDEGTDYSNLDSGGIIAIVDPIGGRLSNKYSPVAKQGYSGGIVAIRKDQFSDAYPRIQVKEGILYMKLGNNILSGDVTRINDEDYAPSLVINPEELHHNSIPSNHCIDSNGRVWVLTRTPEEQFPSLKAYDGKAENGSFLTHRHLSNFYIGGHYGAMAISPNDILAHTNPVEKTIEFYVLPVPDRHSLRAGVPLPAPTSPVLIG